MTVLREPILPPTIDFPPKEVPQFVFREGCACPHCFYEWHRLQSWHANLWTTFGLHVQWARANGFKKYEARLHDEARTYLEAFGLRGNDPKELH